MRTPRAGMATDRRGDQRLIGRWANFIMIRTDNLLDSLGREA